MEFLTFFLSKLHEELNRVQKKALLAPTSVKNKDSVVIASSNVLATGLKKREEILMQEDSEIQDLFQGEYLSVRDCSFCHSKNFSFEMFYSLTIEFPSGQRNFFTKNFLQPVGLTAEKEIFSLEKLIHQFFLKKKTIDNLLHCSRCGKSQKHTIVYYLWRAPKILTLQIERFSTTEFLGQIFCEKKTELIGSKKLQLSLDQYYHADAYTYGKLPMTWL